MAAALFLEVGWNGRGRRWWPSALPAYPLLARTFCRPEAAGRVGVGQRGASHPLGCRHSSVAQVSRRTAILIRHGESVWNEAQVRSARRARAQTCLSGN